MMFTNWPDTLVLFGLRAVELGCLCYFLAPLPKRKAGGWITAFQILVFTSLLIVFRELIYQYDWEAEFVYINFTLYPMLFFFIMLRYDLSVKEGIYYLLLDFLCVHPLRPLAMRISTSLFGVNYLVNGVSPINNLLALAIFAAILCFEFTVLQKSAFRYPKHKLTWPQLGLIIIATIPIFYVTNLFLVIDIDKTKLPTSALLIGEISSICGLAIVTGYNNTLAVAKYKQDMVMLETLLATQTKQYQLKKETIEIINARYHDLKKHINYLASIDTPKEREEYLKTFKLQISPYDAFHETGNDTLDIVLSDKDMECRKHGIGLLLFIDGKQLDFLKQLDIVTIFGNAIDNGIEAVKDMPEECRTITVRMHEYDTWIVVSFENLFESELKWKGNRLLSTKTDNNGHGYGLINIENTVETYGGNVTVEVRDKQFVLKILFPKQKQSIG